jgi:GR25 family glycosyltransferase involved in LPS biosynthesis
MQDKFAQHGIQSVQRFGAIDGDTIKSDHWAHTRGAYGCLLSHVEVVKQARQEKAPAVLIFEDDAVFDPEFQSKLATFINEVPADWDMLYLGALHKDEPVKITDHVYRITKANSTFAYALKSTVFDAFIDLNSRAEHVLDMNSYVLQERFNCYCFMPNLVWVEDEYSDVQNRLERHWYLKKSLVLFGAHVDDLLSQTAIVIAHDGAQHSKNLAFLTRYYEEYFSPLIEIVIDEDFDKAIARAGSNRNFFILTESDLYLETMDIRANLLICEEFDCATGFAEVIDLTHEQALRVRQTGITRGIDVTKNSRSKNTRTRFLKRRALDGNVLRLFQSPNHALRLPRD